MTTVSLRLTVMPWRLAVCRLPQSAVPTWAEGSAFLARTVTPTETSLVCEQACVPANVHAERDWGCLMVAGPLDFALVGIVARLTAPLADRSISVFVISTFDTDYLLVKQDRLGDAIDALTDAGCLVYRD